MANSAFSPTLTVTGGTTQQGEINVITNPIAQSDTSGWTTSNVTLSRVATGSPLDPEIPTGFQAVSTTTTTSYAQTTLQLVAPSLRNRKLKLQFFLALTSSTSWKVDVFKSDGVTRYPLSTDSSAVSVIPALTGTFTTTFDMDTDTGIYVRFTRHAGSGSTTLNFTNLIVGPGIQPQGAVVGSEINYGAISIVSSGGGAVKGTASVDRFIGTRNGQYLDVRLNYQQTAAGSAGTGYYQISVPTGFTIDLSQLLTDTIVGSARLLVSPSTNYTADVMVISSTRVYLRVYNDTTNGDWGASVVPLSTTAFTMSAAFSIPIAEWSGSGTVQLAQNDVEWAWSTDTTTTAGNTQSDNGLYGYGPSGTSFLAIDSNTANNQTRKRVRFQTPIQTGDVFTVEVNRGDNLWLPVPLSNGPSSAIYEGTARYGVGYERVSGSNTDIYVAFGNAGATAYKGTAKTYGELNTDPWTGYIASKWRVRKSSAGAAVGFGIVSSQSAGLLPVSNSNFDDVTATRLGYKQYLHGTTYNGGIAPTVTSAQGGFLVARAVFIPYQNQDLSWRLRFTITAIITSASVSSVTISVNGVTNKNVTNQAINGFFGGNSNGARAYATPGTGDQILQVGTAATASAIHTSGDIELESKPTWAY